MDRYQNSRAIHPVILSGGAGTRLWPLSRKLYPKQLLPLVGGGTMIQDTVRRVSGPEFASPIVICNQDHRFLVAEQLRAAGAGNSKIVLEPVGRNTAPAAAVAALMLTANDPDAIMLVMPADHIIGDRKAFLEAVNVAAIAAIDNSIVTFGITPTAPETGYGYIQRAVATDLVGCYAVERFVEKPDRQTAVGYLEDGDYCWNSGIFLFKAQAYLDELARLEPAMFALCKSSLCDGHADRDFLRLDEKPFAACPSKSIDYAVMEHAQKVKVVPVDMGWSDVGSWLSLWENSLADIDGNVSSGDVVMHNVTNSYLRTDGPMIATVGLQDVIVVATTDAVLVAHRDAAQDVKAVVEQLERSGRHLHVHHRKVDRPWGSYDSVDSGDRFQVKRIVVKPGAQLSLQMHHHRAEHWIVVSGTAKVTCDDKVFLLGENESTFIPLGAKHRLENPGTIPLHVIEVQSGAYLGEDDIVRFEDSYGR